MDHLNKKGRIFLVGIGGIGMSGIAEVLHNLGYEVTGSDQKEGSNVVRLKKLGIKIKIGHNASNIKGSSLIVYSSAIKKQNVEIKEAIKIKIPLISRAEMLAELMRMKKTITVAGSHGKTTTISIISEIFVKSELDPTVINGGIINSLGSNTRLGFGDWMIVETDESDGSFTKLPSFSGLITSIDDEHIDFYNNMRSLENAFEQYINNISVCVFSVISSQCSLLSIFNSENCFSLCDDDTNSISISSFNIIKYWANIPCTVFILVAIGDIWFSITAYCMFLMSSISFNWSFIRLPMLIKSVSEAVLTFLLVIGSKQLF